MFKSLQAGRAIAALLVVFFHLGDVMSTKSYFGVDWFASPFSFGSSGVEFFFVLSGFIIFYAHRDDLGNPGTLLSYLYKRIIRIYPAYLMIFAGVLAISLLVPQLRGAVSGDVGVLIKAALLYPQNEVVFGDLGYPVLVVAWTLQFEMLFYLFFAFAIVSKKAGLVALLVFFGLFGFGLTLNGYHFPLSFLSSHLIWLFLMGMLIARIVTLDRFQLDKPFWPCFLGVFLYAAIALDVVTDSNLLADVRVYLYGVAFSLIIFSMVMYEKQGRVFLGGRFFQLLGSSSYALYLIHFPVVVAVCKVAVAVGLDRMGGLGALVTAVMATFVSIFVSIVFHLYFEMPIARKLKSFTPRSRKTIDERVANSL